MTDFHMPDSYYDPPEYDGCEDCDCEEAEYPEPVECRDHDDCQHPCTCKCHDIPHDPNEDGDDDRHDDPHPEDYPPYREEGA